MDRTDKQENLKREGANLARHTPSRAQSDAVPCREPLGFFGAGGPTPELEEEEEELPQVSSSSASCRSSGAVTLKQSLHRDCSDSGGGMTLPHTSKSRQWTPGMRQQEPT